MLMHKYLGKGNFYLCLTMSAKLMKSKFVHLSSVRGTDYLWSYCMDFFQILAVAPPGPYAQMFDSFLKKKILNFLRIFFVFVKMGPYGSENLLLLQIGNRSRKFSNFSWIFFLMVLTKLCSGFLKLLAIFCAIVAYGETKTWIMWKMSDLRAKRSEIWNLRV